MSRRDALKRLIGLQARVEEHLALLATEPASPAATHWRSEVRNWLSQMLAMLPHVGRRTSEEWTQRLRDWEIRLGELP
ncbi:MAG: hypothetical protein K2R98_11905 [Gemmataceae bacterium]|nr:hypothetical protein [Gemmataceae bacterium]